MCPIFDFHCSVCGQVTEYFGSYDDTPFCTCGVVMSRMLSAPHFKFETTRNGKWVGDTVREIEKQNSDARKARGKQPKYFMKGRPKDQGKLT